MTFDPDPTPVAPLTALVPGVNGTIPGMMMSSPQGCWSTWFCPLMTKVLLVLDVTPSATNCARSVPRMSVRPRTASFRVHVMSLALMLQSPTRVAPTMRGLMTSRWEFPASRFTNGSGMEMENVSPGLGLAAVASKETSRKKKFPRISCRPGGGTGSPVSVTWVNVTGSNLMALFSSARAGVSCIGMPNTATTRAVSTAMQRRHGDDVRTSVMNPLLNPAIPESHPGKHNHGPA